MNTINLVHVTGQGLFTFDAYCEYRLQLSTGDFHTHQHCIQTCDASLEYTDINENGEFYLVNEVQNERA